MYFSVGVLYSAQTLLGIVSDGGLKLSSFQRDFDKIDVANAQIVLALSQECRWIRLEKNGEIKLTERGTALLSVDDSVLCLREQLLDLVVFCPPPWARRLIQGRFEALQAMPDGAQQCFRDCQLTTGTDDDVVNWWDRASQSVRTERTKLAHRTGRQAEKLTLIFEKRRTGLDPLWQAIESNVSGYDVLSCVDASSALKLKIEVKGSVMRRKEASFFLTRNEWQTAEKSHAYIFHLWLVHENPVLFAVPAADMAGHVPVDGSTGRWETAQLYFRDFAAFEQAC